MIDVLQRILKPILKIWNLVFSKVNEIVRLLGNGIFFVLSKIIGKNRLEKIVAEIAIFSKKLVSAFENKFDVEGAKFPVIMQIYRFTFKSTLVILIYIFCIETNFLWLCGRMPSIEQLTNPKIAQSSVIYTEDGEELGKFFTENRKTIDSSDMSPWLFKALIATEDKRFNEHSGIDLQSMAGVFVGIFQGGERGGGSTITQQLAKNLYSTRKSEMKGLLYYVPIVKTIVYKTKEWLTAIRLERNFTKGDILTMYLNTVDYGNNAFGIQTAAQTYFSKNPKDLLPEEAAILVGLQKGTTLYNPVRNPKNALKRRNVVLQLMAQNGALSQAEADKLCQTEIKLEKNLEYLEDNQGGYLKKAVEKYIEAWAKKNDVEIDLYRDGLKIYTTIHSKIQDHAEKAVVSHMKRLQKIFDQEWEGRNPWIYENGDEIPGFIDTVAKRSKIYKLIAKKYKNNPDSIHYYMYEKKKDIKVFSWDEKGQKTLSLSPVDSIKYYKRFLQAGMMAMDPSTGFIKAWVGGIDHDYFQYDHVRQGKRQPGSTFKPVVYTAAIDGPLNLSPCDKRTDEPFTSKPFLENGVEKTWEPKNADGVFTHQNMTLRRAIARSVNSIAAKLSEEVGIQTIVDYAQKLGISSKLEPVISIGLGTSDVSIYDMVGAYGVFANGGEYIEPMLVFKIIDSKGKEIIIDAERRNAISEESAFLMQYMLRGGVEESGGTSQGLFEFCSALFANGGQVAGKTGTTSNYSDAWYMGFTKDLVCGVWVGGDDRSIHFKSRMGEGARSALPIFGKFMQSVYTDSKLGYSAGPFPSPKIDIKKEYKGCVSTGGIEETSVSDSTSFESDSIGVEEDNPFVSPSLNKDSVGSNHNR